MSTLIKVTKQRVATAYGDWQQRLAKDLTLLEQLKEWERQLTEAKALQTGKVPRIVSDEEVAKIARELDSPSIVDRRHLFTVTPLNPIADNSDTSDSTQLHSAAVSTFGGCSNAARKNSLVEQYANNEIILEYDAVDPSDHGADFGTHLHLFGETRRCTMTLVWSVLNPDQNKQFVLYFSIRGVNGATTEAQYFLNQSYLLSKNITSDDMYVLPLKVPQPNVPMGTAAITVISVRLASTEPRTKMGFRGVECYVT
jgi:hypothetical protein